MINLFGEIFSSKVNQPKGRKNWAIFYWKISKKLRLEIKMENLSFWFHSFIHLFIRFKFLFFLVIHSIAYVFPLYFFLASGCEQIWFQNPIRKWQSIREKISHEIRRLYLSFFFLSTEEFFNSGFGEENLRLRWKITASKIVTTLFLQWKKISLPSLLLIRI